MTYRTRYAFLMNRARDIARHAHMSSANGRDLPALFYVTDPKRTPHPEEIVAHLPAGAGVIYRHFGDPHATAHARVLRTLCDDNGVKLLIGQDVALAEEVAADGVHLPERALANAPDVRERHGDWLITGACHGCETLDLAEVTALDGLFISPVFASQSPSAKDVAPLGLKGIQMFCDLSPVPVLGLGGIGADNAEHLTHSGLAGFGAVEAFQLK
ncbi:thiamine phosphate synthase [Asticcacaulis sp.]|uniref:thiamine phosphate synthase n=1 Tax=unclassified Asticcacaulis TaxID=2628350 RepID=UPI0025C5B5C3|nr:thiamine phosphate synthase [Asticcacaulis sp.]MCA1934341.1 thiamine phosphate synthase [Asticcacaulis sp.]